MATELLDEKNPESGEGVSSEGIKDGGLKVEEKSKAKSEEVELNHGGDDEEEVKTKVDSSPKEEKKRKRDHVKKKAEENEEEEKEEEDDEDENPEKKMENTFPDAKESVTPKDRPTRERKAVERYAIASPASRSSSGKPLLILKGSGTSLKDIPNVAFKLSKRKPDDNLQLLHTILFGKKAKAHSLKRDIGQFSGFIWVDNEGKQRAKIKEKIDKCIKEKLLDFCDVLNIPINKAIVKKEDLSVKLLEFLESPHATTELLLADKDQKMKRKKAKATPSRRSRSSKSVSSEKKTQSEGKRKRKSKAEKENETNDKDDNLNSENNASGSDDDAAVQREDTEKEDSEKEESDSGEEEEETKEGPTSPKSSSKDKSGAKNEKSSSKKSVSDKSNKSPAKSAKKTSGTPKKSKDVIEAPTSSPKAKGSVKKKQKVDEKAKKEERFHLEDKSGNKKQAGKPAAKSASKGKEKSSKAKAKAKAEPTTEELHTAAVNILKEVDFNTATLSDIIRLLGSHFSVDLMHRKGEVKSVITEVIESMSHDEDEDEEDEDEDGEDSGKE